MKKYEVTFYYHTNCTVEVEAENEKEAIDEALNVDCNDELICNLQEDDDPDVTLIEE